MIARRIYLDTSVIGGYFDPEFKDETRRLWELMEQGLFRFITSTLTLEEVSLAPARVRALFGKTFEGSSLLRPNEESDELAGKYLEKKVVPAAYFDDAQHVAICTVFGVNVIVSWNFKHLANLQRENAFNSVNLLHGYPDVRIVSPTSLLYGHEEDI